MTSVFNNSQKILRSYIYVDDNAVPLETSIPRFSSKEDLISKLNEALKLTVSKVEWTDSRTKPACFQYHDLFWSEVISIQDLYVSVFCNMHLLATTDRSRVAATQRIKPRHCHEPFVFSRFTSLIWTNCSALDVAISDSQQAAKIQIYRNRHQR
jgi:hypothetical protein